MNKDPRTQAEKHGWKLQRSEYLHRAPWLTVRKDTVQLPNGHIIPDYFVLEYPDWVNTIGITKEGMFVLVRQFRYAFGEAGFELCAGVCEKADGSPLETAKRELLEETGYGGGHWQEWMLNSTNPATSNNTVHCFLATGIELMSDATPEPSEDLSVHLFSKPELKVLLETGGMVQASHLAALWKYFALNG